MKFILLSDIHANLPALKAVLEHIEKSNYNLGFDLESAVNGGPVSLPENKDHDRIINLGDTIGFMPYVNETLDLILKISSLNVRGNHDQAVIDLNAELYTGEGKTDFKAMRSDVFKGIISSYKDITDKNLEGMITQFREGIVNEGPLFFSHDNPYSNTGFTKCFNDVIDFFKLKENKGKIGFFGHSHISQIHLLYPTEKGYHVKSGELHFEKYGSPSMIPEQDFFLCRQESPDAIMAKTFDLSYAERALVNVPSVGQPRGGLNYTGYAVFDIQTKKLTFFRLPYDYSEAQKTLIEIGSTHRSIDRLSLGD
jgi:predicted phosphodiesterase